MRLDRIETRIAMIPGKDMPSQIRMGLTRTSEVIPIKQGKNDLGNQMGHFHFEHRREIVASVIGE
jgi:thiamine phosphate synthase YjbQ (UPF0047 family)